jgi:hypothetical protein
MKHLYSLFFVAFILISGCKKDSTDTDQPSQILVGKWHQVSVRNVSYTDGVEESVTEDTDFAQSSYIQFNSNGTIIFGDKEVYDHGGSEGDIFNYTAKNNLLEITNDKGMPVSLSAQITLTGTTLTLQKSLTIPNTDKGDLTLESYYNFIKVK